MLKCGRKCGAGRLAVAPVVITKKQPRTEAGNVMRGTSDAVGQHTADDKYYAAAEEMAGNGHCRSAGQKTDYHADIMPRMLLKVATRYFTGR